MLIDDMRCKERRKGDVGIHGWERVGWNAKDDGNDHTIGARGGGRWGLETSE